MHFSLRKPLHFVERHILVFGFAVAGLVLLIGSVAFVMPRVKQVQALGGLDYKQKQQQFEAQEKYLGELRALRDAVHAVSADDLARLNLVVPRGKDIPGIFRQMQAFAGEAKMSLESVAVSDGGAAVLGSASPTGGLKAMTVSVILTGAMDYNGLKSFLNVVSRQAPLLDLTAISHSPATTAAASTYNFSFRSYYFEG
ncbi:MAG: hypothetical protein AAB445_02765 [Patescibacteria group bacterium]